MKISLDWLRDYVTVDVPLPELLDRLTMIGLVVDSVEERDGDHVLDIETYANRPDTLGHLGIAREVAVMLGRPLSEKAWPLAELPQNTADVASVQIRDEALCPRYCGILVRDVAVGPSPDWLRRRIEAVGLRPINNVVDVTNYVLFATAQPIHAFDFGRISGAKIVIRRARKGETLRDLEGRPIALSPEMLVIADESKPVALAGVIGGEESGVTAATRDVFIESANFDPVSIRQTAKKLGLSTDASYRFERGADVSFAPQAAIMAASLLTGMGGQATRGLLDVYPKPRKARPVPLRRRRIGELLGVDIPGEFVERTLVRLGFKVESSRKDSWRVDAPSFRVDIGREADLIEEIARFYGYDRIPSEVTPVKSFDPPGNKKRDRLNRLRRSLLEQGFDEVINWSFADPEEDGAARSGRAAIAIRNPISAKASVLRTTLLPGLAHVAAWNRNRGLEGVHVFELGNVYGLEGERPQERLTLGLLSTGLLPGAGWQEGPRQTDFFVLKGALESVMAALRYEPCSFGGDDHPFFESGQALAVQYKGQTVGRFGVLRQSLAARFSLDPPVFAGEIDLAELFEKQPKAFQYVPVPRFPGTSRDLSFLIDRDVPYLEVQRVLDRLAIPLLEGYELLDLFARPPVPEGKVSLAVRFRYRHAKRTLLAEEVDNAEREITGQLKAALNIQLREGKIDN